MMRHNRISKLLLLLIIPSLLGLIFTCIFRGYTANLDTDTMLFFCSVSFFYYCGYLLQGALDGIIAFMDVCGFRCI